MDGKAEVHKKTVVKCRRCPIIENLCMMTLAATACRIVFFFGLIQGGYKGKGKTAFSHLEGERNLRKKGLTESPFRTGEGRGVREKILYYPRIMLLNQNFPGGQ